MYNLQNSFNFCFYYFLYWNKFIKFEIVKFVFEILYISR